MIYLFDLLVSYVFYSLNYDMFCNISNVTIVCFISVVAVMSAMKMEMAVQVSSHCHTDPKIVV